MPVKPRDPNQKVKAWQYRMEGQARSCVDRYCELSGCDIKALPRVATPCMDDHLFNPEDLMHEGHLKSKASRAVLKALYLARLQRPDLLWTVNSLARNVTKWTIADDKRLYRLMSYIHHTADHVLTSYVGDEAKDCKLMLFVDASFAGDLVGSKSTTGGLLCVIGPRTYCPITWLCKKQGAVSHSSTEAEVIALDAGVRLEGLPSMDLWEEIINVFGDPDEPIPKLDPKTGLLPPTTSASGNREPSASGNRVTDNLPFVTTVESILTGVDYVPPNVPKPRGKAKLVICEDNDAVIKMCIKARSLNMRHVPRVHRVDLDWLFERILRDANITMKYVNTKQQMADILTKGSFTAAAWGQLLSLIQCGPSYPLVKQ